MLTSHKVSMFRITNYTTVYIEECGKCMISSKTVTKVYDYVDVPELLSLIERLTKHAVETFDTSPLLEIGLTPMYCAITMEQLHALLISTGARLLYCSQESYSRSKRKNQKMTLSEQDLEELRSVPNDRDI
ncbi:hypothetical protein CPT_Slocum_031 [Serratia phage Slocum]|nr:hypothetical protein CPT_Slocum_031 [Serratia phage Slocum]